MTRPFLAVAGLILFPLATLAHGLGMDARVKGEVVRVEVYYDDDTPGGGADVTVYDANKAVVLEGTTDADGVWSFPAPAAGEYTVRAKTDDGHAAKAFFTVRSATSGEIPAESSEPERPSRSEFTGPKRWITAAAGLLLIGAGFTAVYFVIRHRERKKVSGS